ncbi:hypothetical protein L7F22_060477 [Adiantum nelumboides]|nr:hypothetical protein [Adiantum nelumboides]
MLTHRCYERKVKVKPPRPKPIELQAKLSGAHSLYFDEAYKQKVDKASVGISIQDENGQMVFGKGLLVENTHSNNEAEHASLALGLEWCPSVHRDVQHWCKTCKQCQLAGDRHLTYEPQTPILSYGPFKKWDIDAIGPLPRFNSGKLYIIMGMYYMTGWAKATTLARITTKEVAKFVYESICYKFGVPLEILFDKGPSFKGDLVGELMKKLGIERRHFTPYYPQCNGLVEKINGMICKIITKQVVSKPKDWDKHLSVALWAYTTSFGTSLGYTSYHLVFGKEEILPIEV